MITMLRTKEIQKIRVMYYEQGYTTTEIARIMKISRDTVHKYTQFMDMSTDIKVSRNANKMAKYKDEMIGILNYDRLHHSLVIMSIFDNVSRTTNGADFIFRN